MPYSHKKVGNKTCVYKKDTGKKVGCTKGPVKKYLAALHANVDESTIVEGDSSVQPLYIKATGANRYAGGSHNWLRIQKIEKGKSEGDFVIFVKINGQERVVDVNINSPTPNLIYKIQSMPVSLSGVIKYYFKNQPSSVNELKKAIKQILKEMFFPSVNAALLKKTIDNNSNTTSNENEPFLQKKCPKCKNVYMGKKSDECPRCDRLKKQIKEEFLTEDEDSPMESYVSKKLQASVEDLDEYMNRPENVGDSFSTDEVDTLQSISVSYDEIKSNKVTYSSVDKLSGKNKILNIIKKQGHYVAFFSMSEPIDLTSDENPDDQQMEPEKTEVIIYISKPFKDGKPEDTSLLSNFIIELVSELQIK